ncbi:MAG: hypothetical protein WD904_08265 [Dehalococcoidia bacterium]
MALLALALLGTSSFGGGADPALAHLETDCDVGNAAWNAAVSYDGVNDECDLNVAVAQTGVLNLLHTLHIGGSGRIDATAGGITINISDHDGPGGGSLIMDPAVGATGSQIEANDTSTANSASPITINVTGDILMGQGSDILANDTSGNGNAAAVTISADGDMEMACGSTILAQNTNGAGNGANIAITVGGDMTLKGPCGTTSGAVISSSRTVGTGTGAAGNITIRVGGPRGGDPDFECLSATGDFLMESGAASPTDLRPKVQANAANGPAGIIVINACHNMDIDGLVESASGSTGTGSPLRAGGPIDLITGCTLTISDTGKVSSRSFDPRGDRVHLEGCDVFIYGIVESVARAHDQPNLANGCKGPDRPDKPNGVPLPNYPYTNYSSNCVEVWGKSITIDASGAHNGQVSADSGGGGNTGTGWIELDARENITLIGCSTTVAGDCSPDYYLVHANGLGGSGNAPGEGSLGGEEGGLINVTSTEGGLASSGLVFAAFAGNQGSNSDGGALIIETNTGTALGSSINDVGGADLRGIISARSYNGTVTGAAPGLLDTCGSALGATDGDNTCVPAVPVSPRLVTLQGCGPDNLDGPPNDGVAYTGTTDPTPFTQPNDLCGSAPVVQLRDTQRLPGVRRHSGAGQQERGQV